VKRFLIALTAALAAFFTSAKAGPPEGMVRQMIPFPAMCLPATAEKHHFAALMKALISDYGVHISLSFSASQDQSRRVVIIENPHSGLAGVLMITDEQTCIAFSGEDRQEFIRPPDHPVGTANEAPKT
tara:strand:+ start:760 stop:1143 length:384 start_codon:yes stop_codon:yes gene_type:complete